MINVIDVKVDRSSAFRMRSRHRSLKGNDQVRKADTQKTHEDGSTVNNHQSTASLGLHFH